MCNVMSWQSLFKFGSKQNPKSNDRLHLLRNRIFSIFVSDANSSVFLSLYSNLRPSFILSSFVDKQSCMDLIVFMLNECLLFEFLTPGFLSTPL